MAILIDTSVIVGLDRRAQPLVSIRLLAPPQDAAMSTVTVSELLVGVLRTADGARRAIRQTFVESVIDGIPQIAFDVNVARIHAQLVASLAATGRTIGHNDLMIAATALAVNFDILTDNRREFERVPGLTVIEPTWERLS